MSAAEHSVSGAAGDLDLWGAEGSFPMDMEIFWQLCPRISVLFSLYNLRFSFALHEGQNTSIKLCKSIVENGIEWSVAISSDLQIKGHVERSV